MSSQFWNYLELPMPVILSSPLTCSNAYGAVFKLKTLLMCIKNTMNDLKQLNLEAAALSRLIYRTKHKLRQEKSFKMLQMINRCLTNYLSIHLPFTVNSIQDTLVDDQGPSRQMLEWALVRLLSVAHLFHRVYSLCTQAAGHLFVRMKLAHMYEITFFAVAVVSRIWTYAQFIVRKSCEWYASLYQFQDSLQSSPHPWLPQSCVLPSDLAAALDNPAYLKLKSVSKPNELSSQLNTPVSESEKAQMNSNLPIIFDLDDIGETISREPTNKKSVLENELKELASRVQNINEGMNGKHKRKKPFNDNLVVKKQVFENGATSPPIMKNPKATKTKDNDHPSEKTSCNSYSHSIKSIKSSKDLLKFLEVESSLRKSLSNSKTKHQPLMKKCDKLQWSMMEKFMKKQAKLLSESESCGNLKLQEKLLKRVQKNIKTWVSS